MSVTVSLAQLDQQAAAAYYRHAERPGLLGPRDEHERLWTQHYEALCAAAERNPAFAQTLLPLTSDTATLPLTGPGLPLLPVGVRAVVDEAAPNTVTVSIEVGSGATLTVTPPGVGVTPFSPAFTSTATRSTATFPAPADGLYALALTASGSLLATVYVPVQRAEWARFREQVRALKYAYTARRPALTAEARARLACLIICEAAAHTGDPVLFTQTAADAAALPVAPSPVALSIYG